ncbi:MAG: hypothetical protein ACK5W4_05505 [Inhella sp.]|uniref:hypothetical protein n=1 Tax=Inhella sp. TaxID=1921806 RepID=UPI00391C92AD
MISERLKAAVEAYFEAFGKLNPWPACYDNDTLAERLEAAVAEGKPFPDDFDFHSDLPPDAMA